MEKEIQKLFDDKIENIEINELKDISSISNQVALQKNGIYHLNIQFKDKNNKELIWKIKSNDIVKNGRLLLSKKSLKLKIGLLLNHKIFSYDNSCVREITVYNNIDETLKKYIRKYYGYYTDKKTKTLNLILKYENNDEYKVDYEKAKKIFDIIIRFHTFYYNKTDEAEKLKLNIYSENNYKKAKKCLKELYNKRHKENIKYYGEDRDTKINSFIDSIEEYVKKYSYHRTFTHNDFSTRNIFYNNNEILFYDFELACYQNPEHDLIEFLIYELENFNNNEITEIIKYYKDSLFKSINIQIDDDEYKKILIYNIYEFIINRLSLLRIVGETIKIDFIKKILINSNKLLDIIER